MKLGESLETKLAVKKVSAAEDVGKFNTSDLNALRVKSGEKIKLTFDVRSGPKLRQATSQLESWN
jgi:hypothetical protein